MPGNHKFSESVLEKTRRSLAIKLTNMTTVKPRLHDCQTGCQTGLQPVGQQVVWCIQISDRLSIRLLNRFDNRLDVCLHDAAGCPTGCSCIV